MFNNLTNKFSSVLHALRGQTIITESNIAATLEQIKTNLLEADVALKVVKNFVEKVSHQAMGTQVVKHLNPSQEFVRIIQQQLQLTLGDKNVGLKFKSNPAVILMAGIQGAGKTTASAKLALWLKQHQKKSVMLVSTDIYRPAAMEQLQSLAASKNLDYYNGDPSWSVKKIVKLALKEAATKFVDVVIIDTAGRLHLDTNLMTEIKLIHTLSNPSETLFVVDAMLGQEAANIAAAFNQTIDLTGVILSKADSDTRGGAALSVTGITGKKIKFLSNGEKLDEFSLFHPERLASLILGMGDVMSLIEEAEQKVDRKKSEQLVKKIKKGTRFNFNDFLDQIQQMQSMGGIQAILDKLPANMSKIAGAASNQLDDKSIKQMTAIVNSMTKQEKRFPDIINNSRKRRITLGSGTNVPDFNKVMKYFKQMQKGAKKMTNSASMTKIMHKLDGMQNQTNTPRFK